MFEYEYTLNEATSTIHIHSANPQDALFALKELINCDIVKPGDYDTAVFNKDFCDNPPLQITTRRSDVKFKMIIIYMMCLNIH